MLSDLLEKWCDVFLPQRDGELIPALIESGCAPAQAFRIVFRQDVAALDACDAMLINLDGRAVDEGAAFELGYAFALGKVCVGYHTDVRVLLPWGLNPMVTSPLLHTFGNYRDLEAWARTFAMDTTPSASIMHAGR